MRRASGCSEGSEELWSQRSAAPGFYNLSTEPKHRQSLPPAAHQLYRLSCCDSHATSFEIFPSSIDNSRRRRSVAISSGTSEAVSRFLDPSRRSPLGENLAGLSSLRLEAFHRRLPTSSSSGSIPSFGVTPRNLLNAPFGVSSQLRNAHLMRAAPSQEPEPILRMFEDTFLIHRS